MLNGSGKYKLQRPDKDASEFYECVGMHQGERISISEKKQLPKKKLVDHYIINVNGGKLGFDLKPQLSKSVMQRKGTGVNLNDSFSDDSSEDWIDIDEYQNVNQLGEIDSQNQVGGIIRENEY